MKELRANFVQKWLIKSLSDLKSAKKLSLGDEDTLDTAVYHCQQSAEKALKAFLLFHEIEFPKTHDLRVLIKFALEIDSEFKNIIELGELLTPFATEYRYPDDNMNPTLDEFKESYCATTEIYNLVSKKLIQIFPLFNS